MSRIQLEPLENKSVNHVGYGAGSGSIITETFKCVCGKGTVTYEKDDIPGFKDKSIWSDCAECNEKFDFERGVAVSKEL